MSVFVSIQGRVCDILRFHRRVRRQHAVRPPHHVSLQQGAAVRSADDAAQHSDYSAGQRVLPARLTDGRTELETNR